MTQIIMTTLNKPRKGDVVRFDELPDGTWFEFITGPSGSGTYFISKACQKVGGTENFRLYGDRPGLHGYCRAPANLCLVMDPPREGTEKTNE